MGHRKSVSNTFQALGIQRVFVWYSGVFGIVFKVFGFFAQRQVLHIPHLALLQIPTNYPFYNIKGGECGIREGWSGFLVHQVMSSSRILPRCSSSTCGVLKGAFQNMPQSNVRKEPPPACHRQGEVVPYVCIRPLHPFPSTSTFPRNAKGEC